MTHQLPNINSVKRRWRAERGIVRLPSLSVGTWVIVLLAAASSVATLAWPVPKSNGRVMWTFAAMHSLIYKPVIDEWNRSREPKIFFFATSWIRNAHMPFSLGKQSEPHSR